MTRRRAQRIVTGMNTDARNEIVVARQRLAKLTPWQKLMRISPLWSIGGAVLIALAMVMIQSTISGWAPKDRVRVEYRDLQGTYTKPGEQPYNSRAARIVAHQTCGGYAQTFDVQDQAVLVYACADGKLKILTYLPGNG